MSYVYSVEDLLRLRASPLSVPPKDLPPIEKWMGTLNNSEKRPTTRGKTEENSSSADAFQKRPTLLDTQGRRSTADPDRLIFGPPRRSFASSNTRRFGAPDENDASVKEKPTQHDRRRTGEDIEARPSDRRNGPPHEANGKSTGRHDGEEPQSERPRRRLRGDELDLRARKESDRPKWAHRDGQESEEKPDEMSTKGRRDPHARTRYDQPWIRGGKPAEATDDGGREVPSWRRPGRDRDYGTSERLEVDPEWMDSEEAIEPTKAHTQQDFQQWMENMKKHKGGAEVKSAPDEVDQVAAEASVEETKTPKLTNLPTPAAVDGSIDKFFEKFGEKKAAPDSRTTGKPTKSRFASIFSPQSEPKLEQVLNITPSGPDAPDKTETPTLPVAKPAAPHVSTSSDADKDKEAFAKLMAMLNQNQASPAQVTDQRPSAASSVQSAQPTGPEAVARPQIQSPDLAALFTRDQPPRQALSAHSHNASLDRLAEPRTPTDHGQRSQTKVNSEELLLNLLRRSDLADRPVPSNKSQGQALLSHLDQAPPPRHLGAENQHSDPSPRHQLDQRRELGHSIFDDPAISNVRYRESNEPQPYSQMRSSNGANVGMFADMVSDTYRQNQQQPQQHPKQVLPPQNLPLGFSRPPGLDQMSRMSAAIDQLPPRMPPGWPANHNQHQNQHQHQHQPQQQHTPLQHLQQNRQGPLPPAPPGIALPPNRGMSYGDRGPQSGQLYSPGGGQRQQQPPPPPSQQLQQPQQGQPQQSHQQQHQQQRLPHQRNKTGDAGLPPPGSLPSSLAPPPGFGLPPGYQPQMLPISFGMGSGSGSGAPPGLVNGPGPGPNLVLSMTERERMERERERMDRIDRHGMAMGMFSEMYGNSNGHGNGNRSNGSVGVPPGYR